MTDRALILCRQSLTRTESVSLDHQEARGRAYCEAHGYSVVAVIREENTRGWREDRTAMVDIRDLAARGGFDVLIAFDTSRVARKLRLLENLIHDLDRFGVRLESVTQDWVNQTLMRQVVGAFDEERSRDISRHVAGAIRQKAASGIFHGAVPYGYCRGPDRRLIPVPAEATVIRTLFERFADGWSILALRQWLNTDPTVPPRRRGGRWGASAVWHALHAEVYAGRIIKRSG